MCNGNCNQGRSCDCAFNKASAAAIAVCFAVAGASFVFIVAVLL